MRKLILFCLCLGVVLPVVAQTITFTPKRTRDYDPRKKDGYCTIRVRVDDVVEVELEGDRVTARAISGRESRDEGSECSQPMPSGYMSKFEFKGIDGRGNVRLIQEPSASNGWRAIVRIEDKKGGDEGYTYRLSWSGDGGGSSSGGGSSAGRDLTVQSNGRGQIRKGTMTGDISKAEAQLRRDGTFEIRMITSNNTHRFTGRWRERSREEIELDVRDGFGFDGAQGTGRLFLTGGGTRLDRISLNGKTQLGSEPFEANFGVSASGGGSGLDGGWGNSGGGSDLNLNQTGRGLVFYDQREERIQQAEVRLTNNGREARINIRLTNGQTLYFSGSVRDRGNQGIEIDVRDSNFGQLNQGAARVSLSGNSIEAIQVFANASRGRVWLQFSR